MKQRWKDSETDTKKEKQREREEGDTGKVCHDRQLNKLPDLPPSRTQLVLVQVVRLVIRVPLFFALRAFNWAPAKPRPSICQNPTSLNSARNLIQLTNLCYPSASLHLSIPPCHLRHAPAIPIGKLVSSWPQWLRGKVVPQQRAGEQMGLVPTRWITLRFLLENKAKKYGLEISNGFGCTGLCSS